ncbi:LPS export ABC transporter periplasmic protein LptC [Shewanella inventionis]|uniref:Lipopolysaccharide export system protein LptC n=1 Tax=Shewanella inventionis TaxID=1738770 RepID=A0ABQ1IPI6_9GAMM|nr:LPS export ABC transporter periplasmic protein LptC [Shewanella inventionis]MCL1156595.1 LPS export ABC transporter periplasmic protein LptC [Shewanella inventionis]UAL44287.1 LPS export ABC transporter periplasmic protein LptC [Shewanella inventionis]GGB46694.1 lipopolysaccharide export system protein LptC [Shewanella inventionis]
MNRVTIGITAFFGLALALYWQTQVKRSEMDAIQVVGVERPDFIADDLKTTEFNAQGFIESKVTAKHMEHYASSDITHFTEPVYLIYPENGKAQWQLSADRGQLNKQTNQVSLENNVIIDAIDIEEPLQSLTTQAVALDLSTMIGSSQDMVYIKGKGFMIQGLGLHADLNSQKLSLLSQVEGTYESQ